MCVVVWYPQCKYINNFRFFKKFLRNVEPEYQCNLKKNH